MSGRAAKAERRASQTTADVTPQRFHVAHRWATYRGDHVESLGAVMGPNTLGERMVAVTCDYDPEADKSRLGFAFGGQR